MQRISKKTADLIRSLSFNEWSDEARAAALEARRRKIRGRLDKMGYRIIGPRQANKYQPSWVNKWERKNLPKIDAHLRRFNKRIEQQTRDFASPTMSRVAKFGRLIGTTQLMEKVSGSKGSHSSWVDKRTGYRYDFHPASGSGIIGFTEGKVVETSPDGTKRELKGPEYNLFKRNCQMANKFLPKFIKKFSDLRKLEQRLNGSSKSQVANEVRALTVIINGGPGSGFHGHKGVPGQRGGSAPEGSAGGYAPSNSRSRGGPVGLARLLFGPQMPSEAPHAVARRAKNVFTKTSRLADLYETYAQGLETKRKKKWMPLKAQELSDLKNAHASAAKHYYDSAQQATMVKGSTTEEQRDRLNKADEHARLSMKYAKRLGSKVSGGSFTRSLGKAFVEGAIGGSIEELPGRMGAYLGQTGSDIAMEGIRSGFQEALRQKDRTIKGKQDLTMPKSEISAAESLARQMGGSPFTPRERARFGTKVVVPTERKPSFGEAAHRVAQKATVDAIRRAEKHKEAFFNRGKQQDQAARIQDAIDYAEYLRKAEADIKKQRRQLGDTLSARETGKKSKADIGDVEALTADEKIQRLLNMQAQRIRDQDEELTNSEYQEPTFNFAALIANLSGRVRRETLHDREYLVAPLTMIVPGVLAGSKGPLLYPEDEVSKNPTAWNGMPIVVNHPMINGVPVEARSPGILNKYQIGTVFNAKYNGKLVAEGWFDIGRTRKTNIGIYEQLVNNKPIELSTGLYTDNEAFKGTWNGRKYEYVARNYRPDHLAILLGSRGACSIKDGCGVLINTLVGKRPEWINKITVPEKPEPSGIAKTVIDRYKKKRKPGLPFKIPGMRVPTANIVKKTKGGYKLVSHKGKNLGTAKSKAGILKRERQVEYFKHVSNGLLGRAGKAVGRKIIDTVRGTVKAKALGPAPPKQIWKAEVVEKGVLKKLGSAIKKHPTATALAGAGAAGYAAGRRKKRTDNIRTEVSSLVQVINFGYQVASKAFGKPKAGESKVKKFARMGHHATGGFGSAVAGGVGGAALGAALTGPAAPVGAIIGGAAGSAAGAWAARRQSQKFGKAAGTASDIGGLAGAIATPGGAAKVAGRAAPKLGMAARFKSLGTKAGAIGAGKSLAKGTGRLAADTAAFTGTTAGLDKAFGPKKRRPAPIRNAWTEAARRKSAETRRLRKLMNTDADPMGTSHYSTFRSPAAAVVIGASAGIGSRLGSEAIIKGTKSFGSGFGTMKKVVADSFKDVKAAPVSKVRTGPEQFAKYVKPKRVKPSVGLGRRVISLLKKIRIRRI